MARATVDVGSYRVSRARWAAALERAADMVHPASGVGLCYAITNAAEDAGLVGDRPGRPFEDRAAVYKALSEWQVFQDFRPPLSRLYWFPEAVAGARAEAFAEYRRLAALFMAERVRGGE